MKYTIPTTPNPETIVINNDLPEEGVDNQSATFTIETKEGEYLVNEFFKTGVGSSM